MLTLTIEKKWFDMILSGEKTEEYRELKRYSEENGYLILRAMEVIPETIQRFACVEDMTGERLFEGDVIYNPEHRTVRMEICYGKYAAYCPNDKEYMETVGFYMVSNTTDDAMPLGPTKEYALLLGNVVDNPEIKVV